MPKLGNPNQLEMYRGINYEILDEIIKEGVTNFGPLIIAYNNKIEPGREKIDALDNPTILKIADFLKSKGKEIEARAIEKFLKKDKRVGQLELLKEKPVEKFNTYIEKSFPKGNE